MCTLNRIRGAFRRIISRPRRSEPTGPTSSSAAPAPPREQTPPPPAPSPPQSPPPSDPELADSSEQPPPSISASSDESCADWAKIKPADLPSPPDSDASSDASSDGEPKFNPADLLSPPGSSDGSAEAEPIFTTLAELLAAPPPQGNPELEEEFRIVVFKKQLQRHKRAVAKVNDWIMDPGEFSESALQRLSYTAKLLNHLASWYEAADEEQDNPDWGIPRFGTGWGVYPGKIREGWADRWIDEWQ